MELTVIIPIYNVERFLDECLTSFVNQTNKDFKVVLVDDGSKDNSGEIAKGYVKKYPKLFTYLYQENKGLGGARNTGLKQVDTDYVVFIDSDDFVGPQYINNIYKKINELGDFDIGLTMPAIFDMKTKNYWDYMDAELVETIFKDKAFTNAKESPEIFSIEANFPRAIWNTKFLKENNFLFEERIKWEDIEPHFTLFHAANKIAFLDFNGGYYYRINSGGGQITSSKGKERLDMIHVFFLALEKGKKANWTEMEYVHFLRVMVIYTMWTLNVIDDLYRVKFVKGMSKVYRGIKLKYYFAYRQLPMPYRPYNKRFLIALFMRSIFLRHLFYKRSRTEAFHRIWKKVTGKQA